MLCGLCKAFDLVLHCQAHEETTRYWCIQGDAIWRVFTLYELVIGRVCTLGGLSNAVNRNIGVMQGRAVASMLFGLCMDEVSNHVDRLGGLGASLATVFTGDTISYHKHVSYTEYIQGSHVGCMFGQKSSKIGFPTVLVFRVSNRFRVWIELRFVDGLGVGAQGKDERRC